MELIDKSALVAEIEKRLHANGAFDEVGDEAWSEDVGMCNAYKSILSFLNTLEVKDPYEQCVQYSSIKDGIEAHASIYSFNIESQLFPQLTKEQQALWRKEIEQACISGGDAGVTLARDQRYKENLEVKEVDLEKEMQDIHKHFHDYYGIVDSDTGEFAKVEDMVEIAKYFFELGLKAKGE